MMAALYDVDIRAINEHIKKVYGDRELSEEATIRNFRIVQTGGMTGQQRTEALHASKELSYLERIESLYLDCAELRTERKIPMSMEDWAKRLDGFLEFNGNELLTGPGKISAEQAKIYAETELEKYRIIQDRLYESDFDRFLTLEQSAEDSVIEG